MKQNEGLKLELGCQIILSSNTVFTGSDSSMSKDESNGKLRLRINLVDILGSDQVETRTRFSGSMPRLN